MIDLHQLKTFVAVVSAQSFTAAAHELGYSQSTVTFQIKALEKELGALLFERSRFMPCINLTEEGQNLYQQALQLLNLAEGLKGRISPPL